MKNLLLSLFLFSAVTFSQAQILTNFDNDSLDGWRSEGDGQYYLELNFGNPGSCMRVDDDATGNTNLAIAPLQFLGNWSTADTTDSVITDIYVSRISGSQIPNLWAFRISGPGGRATSTPITPALNQWNYIAIALDSANWNISSGTWQGLLEYINHFEVRAEYINGDEFVRLDNIGLTFSPQVVAISPPVLSDFEAGTFDGWAFENSGGISIPSGGGNPGRYVRISDGTGLTNAVAPPKYLGDWTQLNEQAALMMDLQISNFSGPLLVSDYLIKISGPGGEAIIPLDSQAIKASNQWHTFNFLISQNIWTLTSGNWTALLSDVREVRILMEYISGSEIVLFDNFRISNEPPLAAFSADPLFLFPGEVVQFSDLSVNAPQNWKWVFGDGESSALANPQHAYMQPGIYDVQLIVANLFGNDTLLKEDYIEVAGISDSILYADDFNDNEIHPAWRFRNGTWVEGSQNMIQNSNYFGTGYIDGCFALVGSAQWKNYRLEVDFKSTDNDKIGVVFNYQDANNFYLFTWQQQETHRAIKRFVAGEVTDIAVDTVGYEFNQWYQLGLSTFDGQIDVYIDSILIFSVTDTTFLNGKAGLYCHGNQSSFWDNFKIVNLDYVSSISPEFSPKIAKTYTLDQNYPNPFNPVTQLTFSLPVNDHVTLEVFSTTGQKVQVLVDREMAAGSHIINFDAGALPTGIYFYRIRSGEFQQVRRMVLLR